MLAFARTLLMAGTVLVAFPARPAETTSPFLDFVRARAAALRAADVPPGSLDEVRRREGMLRAELQRAWGRFPASPAPLDPRRVGTLQRDGYRVEKVVFQTLPDVWMTANAYVPDRAGRRPAVLCVHGHWRGAKQDPVVQSRCIGLARLGFFVLVVDAFGAGERAVGKALGEYHGDMTAATLLPAGQPLAGIQVYENLRAVDYLRSRPEVDPERIGITGASGGGNQSMYAGAWDPRLSAIAPVCSVGNYQAYLGAACCLCEVVPGALRFTEESGVLSLAAPRALLVVSATRDAPQFSVAEARRSLADVEPLYRLLGQSARLRHAVFDSPHDYSQAMRETVYGWMQHHLAGEEDGSPIPEPALRTEDPELLRCFPGDSRPPDWITLPAFAARAGRRLIDAVPRPDHAEVWHETARRWRARLDEEVLGGTRPARSRIPSPGPSSNADAIAIAFEPETDLRLTLKRHPADPDRMRPDAAVLVLHLDGASHADVARLVAATTNSGTAAFTCDLRATGVHAEPRDRIGRAPDHNTAEWSLWLGRPLLGQWVLDVRAALDALETRQALPRNLAVVGFGPAGVVAIATAALDPRLRRVVTVGSLASFVSEVPYEHQRLGILAPGILRDVGDIPHLAALVAPRPLLVAGAVHGSGSPLAPDQLPAAFAFTRHIYGLEQAPDALALRGADAVWEPLP